MHTQGDGADEVLRYLAANRTAVYIGGLLVISAPIALVQVGIELPAAARSALVVASLAVMIVTYVAERRVGDEVQESHKAAATGERETYSRRTRLAVAAAVVGLAVGVYVAVEVDALVGLLFIAGAYLFTYVAYRGGDDGGGRP